MTLPKDDSTKPLLFGSNEMFGLLPPLQQLKAQAHEAKCNDNPNFPRQYVPVTSYDDRTANGLTAAVVDWFDLNGGWASRINTTGIYRDGKWTKGTTKIGCPDVLGVISSHLTTALFVGVEIKIGTDRQSAAQKKVQAATERAGGIYLLVHSFDEFHRLITEALRLNRVDNT